MNLFNVITLTGGLALFLYGMNIMGGGLEKIAGSKLERTLEKLTSNVWKGILFGIVVTVAIQSSSATTVICVGLVNAGVMKLRQAIYVTMGANIGTTLTAQLIALSDIEGGNILLSFLKPSNLAPLIATAGILLFMIARRKKRKDLGEVFLGFGVLFAGLFAMESSVAPLANSPTFASFLTLMTNPFFGVLAGTVVTAVIQSSTASIGMLQAIAATGTLTCSAAFPIIMGQNIGTCVTAILSSIGANKNAKRSAIVHLIFNVGGTIFFLIILYLIQFIWGFPFWNDPITRAGIANFHAIFNVVSTLVFIPFVGVLQSAAEKLIPDKGDEKLVPEIVLEERLLATPSLAIGQCHRILEAMMDLSHKGFTESITLLDNYDPKVAERVGEYENAVDKMEDRVGNYLVKLTERELSDEDNYEISELLQMIGEVERISDYCENIMECGEQMRDNELRFSESAREELDIIVAAVNEIIESSFNCYLQNDYYGALGVEPLEEIIDDMQDVLKDRHIERLKAGTCQIYAGITFIEVLANLERLADHCANIAFCVISRRKHEFDRHVYKQSVHSGDDEQFNRDYEHYREKYFDRIQQVRTVQAGC